ncbi:MAG TPA: CDP-glycerol glycerophosphotransferase family protein [Vicinamibacterales bacterium]|jgi:hypothetical protein
MTRSTANRPPARRTLLRRLTPVVHQLDHAISRLSANREVLVELRTPVYHAVLAPIAEALAAQSGVRVWYTSEQPDRVRELVPADRLLAHRDVAWRRFDLYINGDPWAAARLRRCARRVNFFHGVAGKYDLDNPAGLPLGFEYYDRVAFINRDRMARYLAAGIVTPRQGALVGYPKIDRLAAGAYDAAAVRAQLGLESTRPAVLYAPTYSEASSLHLAGEEIVRSLAAAGFAVIVKLHDRSLDADRRYTAGVDWRARFAAIIDELGPSRVAFAEAPDASPLLAAADVMVTDHSSIGFEFLVRDRPLVVFDAPDLAAVARINVEKVAMLRSAATVIASAGEAAAAATRGLAEPAALSPVRRRIASALFHDAGRATERAVALLMPLLHPGAAIPVESPLPRQSLT